MPLLILLIMCNPLPPAIFRMMMGLPCNYYGYQWWIRPEYPGVFYARGILGQYIIVIPSKKDGIGSTWVIKDRTDGVNGLPEEVDALINWGMKL